MPGSRSRPCPTTSTRGPNVRATARSSGRRSAAFCPHHDDAARTGVTCPIIRVHPAIIAQAAATSAALGSDRFFLGIGTGEALNEHVTGERWPPIDQRRDMLAEAVTVMRELWTGETIDHHGRVLHRRECPPLHIARAGAGDHRRRVRFRRRPLRAEHADGIWVTSPDAEVIDAYREAGGAGPVYGQVTLCWGDDETEHGRLALEIWPNAGLPGQLSQDLPTFTHFEQASELVRPEDHAKRVSSRSRSRRSGRPDGGVRRGGRRPRPLPPDRA